MWLKYKQDWHKGVNWLGRDRQTDSVMPNWFNCRRCNRNVLVAVTVVM